MSKILVTGSNGQLGSELQTLAPEKGALNFTFTDIEELDLLNDQAVKEHFHDNQYDYCINCAAYTAVDAAETDEDNARGINVKAAERLSAACKSRGIILFYISTDFIFDGERTSPYVETDVANALSVYGRTKAEGEQKTIENNERSIIIRTSWLYSHFGKNFLKTILRLSEEKEEIEIIDDQWGTPTYARDLASAALTIIDSLDIEKQQRGEVRLDRFGIYHYSNEGKATWYDFAKEIKALFGFNTTIKPIPTSGYPTPATRPAYSVMDKTKIMNSFKLNIPHWKDSLAECRKLFSEE